MLLGGLEHEWIIFPSYWECHHPNWRSFRIFQRVGIHYQDESLGLQWRYWAWVQAAGLRWSTTCLLFVRGFTKKWGDWLAPLYIECQGMVMMVPWTKEEHSQCWQWLFRARNRCSVPTKAGRNTTVKHKFLRISNPHCGTMRLSDYGPFDAMKPATEAPEVDLYTCGFPCQP